jgi:hypothetical protein
LLFLRLAFTFFLTPLEGGKEKVDPKLILRFICFSTKKAQTHVYTPKKERKAISVFNTQVNLITFHVPCNLHIAAPFQCLEAP